MSKKAISQQAIQIRGARQNNLKDLDLKIPLNHITVVTGVSGSGKSSLAFDTLYAEGQRRYIETFSPYARQFMERMDSSRESMLASRMLSSSGSSSAVTGSSISSTVASRL